MTIRIKNTLSPSEELKELKPIVPGKVSMYVCGPTVYDDPHIGHLRSAYVFELIRTVIESEPNTKLTFVRNVTDIDDKIIQQAKKEGLSESEVADKYLKNYHKDLKILGIRNPDKEPKATEKKSIQAMHDMIQRLMNQGVAYESEGNVYFSVRKFNTYGELSHQNIDQMLENVRGEPGEGKKDVLDFALWKKSAEGEPEWGSPWGKGRPGWHIECSAMSTLYLGDEFDIHGGGRDLLFPHHENECAQAKCATQKSFARVWVHHGLLTIDGQKMSKSLNNFLTLDQFLEKSTIDALKLFFLHSHYSSNVDFTWEKIHGLEESLKSFYRLFEKVSTLKPSSPPDAVAMNQLKVIDGKFQEALRNDFDTPTALTFLYLALHESNRLLNEGKEYEVVEYTKWIKSNSERFFGLFLHETKVEEDDWMPLLKDIIDLRNQKRSAKAYEASDFIRQRLIELGFQAEDGKKESEFKLFGKAKSDDLKKDLADVFEKAKSLN